MRKTISKHRLNDRLAAKHDLAYWLTKSPEERISAVELLRRQHYGSSKRLQRVARVVKRAQR